MLGYKKSIGQKKMKSNYTVDGEEWGIYFPPDEEE